MVSGAVLGLVLMLVGCAGPGGAARRPAAPPEPYTRVQRPDADTIQLQIAVRKFVPARGRGPAVWLSGVSHIGDAAYYAALQQHLDAQSLVLFEAIGGRDRAVQFNPEEQTSVQHTLATSLGLVFQLASIRYDRPHFRNSDLTLPELQRLLSGNSGAGDGRNPEGSPPAGEAGRGGEAGGGGREFRELMGIMDGSSLLGAIVHMGIKIIGTTPKLQAMTRLAMIEVLGRFQGDLSEVQGMPPELQRLMTVIIRSRNDVVLRDLKPLLGRAGAGRSISVFYGAGHMADLEQRLVSELGYRRQEEVWHTAMSVNVRASGLSKGELDLVQGLVRWQLESLRTPAKLLPMAPRNSRGPHPDPHPAR